MIWLFIETNLEIVNVVTTGNKLKMNIIFKESDWMESCLDVAFRSYLILGYTIEDTIVFTTMPCC